MLLALFFVPAQAATLYKWVDAAGNVTYQDTPPPENVKFETNDIDTPPAAVDGSGGATMDEASLANPVSLYSVPDCDSCDLVRQYLESNAIPFVEKNVLNDIDLQKELEGKAGALTVPTLIIGDRILNGYSRSAISSRLNQAGFPVTDGSRPVVPAEENAEDAVEDIATEGLEPLDLDNVPDSDESSANIAISEY